ncbi:MAG: transcription termination/antitermination protein NusA [Campylobacteraceae bacterium]|jgi:N utilization substance protein A|nr:transcription termination/antitermination protein NusA [Campylobacteraceae bacterium]MBT3882353.1 transcription termination/antitermination protein NusA [Campylobacteraceae bacterium]MBT4031237.1 transcription termination/antitermination protein NusA [Campylobacteraceae bacterium]MBT4178935.1 transcription termination/antitermination protein NusA [Campylobacteraceae bacterium]MBT4573150.1 transcription termination/antitermination protein NusA [Campylobacteraceae bacterium]
MDKILDILDSIAHEKALTLTQVEEALIEALVRTAKKMGDYTLEYGASIDKENKKLNLFQKIEVLSNDDERLTAETVKGERFDKETRRKVEADVPNNTDNFISLDNAKELDEDLEIGDFVQYDMEFEHMGRNAATILHSNFEYKLQNFVSDNLFEKYQSQIGNIITSNVTSIDPQDNTFVEIGEVRGIMPRKNRIKGEKFKVGDVVKAVVKAVTIDKQHGLVVEISRTSPKFLEALLELEVPELKDKKIEIMASARIPGERAKIALLALDPQIDPIGAIVGVKGMRINAVSEELNNESIDCIEYSEMKEMFVSRALSPAIVNSVKVEEEEFIQEDGYKKIVTKATITIGSDQKSRAIGRAGLNIRLAGMLTKCDIQLNEVDGVSNPSQSNDAKPQEPTKDTSGLEALFK